MPHHTHAEIAARLRGLAKDAEALTKCPSCAEAWRATAFGLVADLLTTARDLDPHPKPKQEQI